MNSLRRASNPETYVGKQRTSPHCCARFRRTFASGYAGGGVDNIAGMQ